MDIIKTKDLASYLRDSTITDDEGAAFIVQQANGAVTEAWSSPVDPAPFWVVNLTLEVAARAFRNPQGLASWTKSVDDASRTERLPETSARAGVYLTDVEATRLGGLASRVVGSIRLQVPGYTCPS